MVRKIAVMDAEPAAKLSGELGYPVAVDVMEQRIRHFTALPDRAVFVACRDGSVVGWIDVGIAHHLHADSYGEIGGLVVSSECRSKGIGAQLVEKAEQWVREQGLTKMLVRSRITREDAHRFYIKNGYERTKTSAVFAKPLSHTPSAAAS